MNRASFPVRALLLAACLGSPLAAMAQGGHPPHQGRMMAPEGPPGHPGALSMLRGLDLSEAQRDKIFAIEHAQAPQRRELARNLQNAHMALRTLAQSGQFDERKAATLADNAGKAMAAMALLQARTDAQVMALLTPEQRKQAADEAQHRMQRPGPERSAP